MARKTKLRAALRVRRAAIAVEQGRRWSEALTEWVLADPRWGAARSVAGFVGVRGEPDTRGVLQAALEGGKRLYLPRVVGTRPPVLEFLPVERLESLVTGAFGLLEPVGGTGVEPLGDVRALDLVLMPGLAFDGAGRRLGFGRGFYDVALAAVAKCDVPVRMGVAFSAFVDPPEGALPVDDYDVSVHAVVTERGIAECSR